MTQKNDPNNEYLSAARTRADTILKQVEAYTKRSEFTKALLKVRQLSYGDVGTLESDLVSSSANSVLRAALKQLGGQKGRELVAMYEER